jgi:hypothetical protein
MAYELAKAYVSIQSDDSKLKSGIGKTRSWLKGAIGNLNKAAKVTLALGTGAAFVAMQKAMGIAKESIALAEVQIDAERRLGAVIKSTGGAAGLTLKQMKDYASELQSVTTFGDEATLQTMALAATFKNIKGDNFKQMIALTQDLAATGLGSMESAALQLGKALEDPTRGMTQLRRIGVSFSESQQQQIKDLQESNQLWKAQGMLLEVVEGQVGGVARELAKTDPGKIKQIDNAIGDIKESIGKSLLPATVQWKESMLSIWSWMESTGVPAWRKAMAEISVLIAGIGAEWAIGIEQMKAAWDDFNKVLAGGTTDKQRAKDLKETYIPLQEQLVANMEEDPNRYANNPKIGTLREEQKELRDLQAELAGLNDPLLRAAQKRAQIRKTVYEQFGLGSDGKPKPQEQPTPEVPSTPDVKGNIKQLLESLGLGGLRGKPDAAIGRSLAPIMKWLLSGTEVVKKAARKAESSDATSPWGGRMGFDQLNTAMQDAMLQNDNPVHTTNEILDKQTKKMDEAKRATQALGVQIVGGVSAAIRGIRGLNLTSAPE